jgi:uncharacterized membrane protein YqjE
MPKDMEQMTIDELRAKEKSLTGVSYVILGLGVVYVLALVVFWLTGRWTSTQTLGLVPLLGLVAAGMPAWSSRRQVKLLIQRRSQAGDGA